MIRSDPISLDDAIAIGNKIAEMADRVKVGHSAIPGAQTTWGFEMDGTHFTVVVAVTPRKAK